jgi:uncharacterized membrane protein YphA (DoxX/SURF4 family)
MDVVELIGRLLFAATFLITPSGVVKTADRVAGSPAFSKNETLDRIPMPVRIAMIRGTSIASMAGAVMVGLGLWPDLGALLIVFFLLSVTPVMHRFWEIEEWLPRKQRRDAFLSNLSLAGGGLLIFFLFNQAQDVALGVLSDPLFSRF